MAGPVRISVVGDSTSAQRALGAVESRARRTARALGTGLAIGTGAGVVALLRYGQTAVKAASDSQQSIGATESVFKRQAATIIRESRRADTALGLSRNEYRETANQLGAMLVNTGDDMATATDKTILLTRRGADLAATFGGTTREAVEAVGAAMRGETDPIERYGISIRQTDIDARLAAKGQSELEGAALKQAQAQARVELILGQSASAAGQFRREQNTLAGQTQILEAKAGNLAAKVGKVLAPSLTDAAAIASNRVVPALSRAVDRFQTGEGRIGAFGDAFRGALADVRAGRNPLGDVADDARVVGDAFADAWPEIRNAARELPSFADTSKVAALGIGFLADNADTLAKGLPLLVTAYGAYKATQLASNVAVAASPALRLAEVAATRAQTAALRDLAAVQRSTIGTGAASGVAAYGNQAATAANKVSRLGTASRVAGGAAGLGALALGATTSNDAVGTLASVGGGALAGFSVGGPIGAAIGGTVGLLGSLATRAEKAEDAAVDLSASWRDYANTLDSVTGSTTESTRALAFQELQQKGALSSLRTIGVDSRTAVDAIMGQKRAHEEVAGAIALEQANINALKRAGINVSERQDAIDALRTEITETDRAVGAKRREILAVRELGPALGKLPPRVQTEIRTNILGTTKSIAQLADKYKLTPKEIRTVIRLTGADTTERRVQRLKRRLDDAGNVRPSFGTWLGGLAQGTANGERIAGRGSRRVDQTLRNTGRGTRANLSTYTASVATSARAADRTAARGGVNVSNALQRGTRATRADLRQYLAGVGRDTDRGEQVARRGADGISDTLRQGTSRSRADLGGFNQSVSSGTGTARNIASSGGTGVGAALKAGVIAGFSGTASALSSAAASAVTQAIAAARRAADSRSPSRKFEKVGREMGQGQNNGYEREAKKGVSAARRLALDLLKAADSGRGSILDRIRKHGAAEKRRKELIEATAKALRKQSRELAENAKAQDRVNQRLEKARDRLKQARDARSAYSASIRASIVAYASVTSVEESHLGSPQGFVENLRVRAAAAERYAALVEQLKRRGLNNTSLRQILDAGPEAGLAAAEALAAGGTGVITEVNKLTERLGDAGEKLGDSMAGKFYDAGVKSRQRLVDGLERQDDRLERVGNRIATNLVKAIRKRLGGAAGQIGLPTGAGRDDDRPGRNNGGNRPRRERINPERIHVKTQQTVDLNVTVKARISAQQLSRAQRGEEIELDLKEYRRLGGKTK